MINEDIILPFKITDLYLGFAECNGILKILQNHLLIEYEIKDGIVNLVKSGIKQIKIPLDNVINIEYKKNIFLSKIILSLKTLKGLSDFPLKENNLILIIPRKYSELAKVYCSTVNLKIAENKLNNLEN
jgi:hypothetical protein